MILVDSVCQRCRGSGWVFPRVMCPDCLGYGMKGRVLDIPVNISRRVRQTPFGRKLRQWREKRKLTFRDVSEILGPWCGECVPPSRLSDIERGKVFPDKYLRKRLWELMRRIK